MLAAFLPQGLILGEKKVGVLATMAGASEIEPPPLQFFTISGNLLAHGDSIVGSCIIDTCIIEKVRVPLFLSLDKFVTCMSSSLVTYTTISKKRACLWKRVMNWQDFVRE